MVILTAPIFQGMAVSLLFGVLVSTLLTLAVVWHGYAGAASAVNPLRAPAEALRARIGDAPIRSLRLTEGWSRQRRLDEVFRLYFGRLVPRILPADLGDAHRDACLEILALHER